MEPIWKFVGIAAYLVVLVGIGVVASRRMGDLRDYFAAGKKLGFYAAAFSARATGESAWLLLGLTGMGAMFGVRGLWVVLGETIGVAIAWLVLARRFHRLTERYDAITIPDYLEARFRDSSHAIRIVAATALTVFVTIYVSAQIDATGKAFASFLGVPWLLGVGIGFGVVVLYSVSGGFLAVVWSDVFQGTLMLLGLVVLPLAGLWFVGGFDGLAFRLGRADADLMTWAGPGGWSIKTVLEVIGLSLIGLGYLGSPQIFARFLSLRSEREIGLGAGVAIAWTLIADAGAVLTGMVGRAILVPAEGSPTTLLGTGAEDVLPELVLFLFPAVLVGLYIAIVLSAIMSTVDSLLVVASSAAIRDFYQKVFHPELPDDALVSRSRIATFGLAAAAFCIAGAVAWLAEGRTVFWFVIFGWSGIAATFCPTMILSLLWGGFTRRGALSAMVAGFLAVPLFKFGFTAIPGAGVYFGALSELPPAFLVSGLVGVLVSLGDKEGQARLADARDDVLRAGA